MLFMGFGLSDDCLYLFNEKFNILYYYQGICMIVWFFD